MGKRLDLLEFARGLAAVAVVLCHVEWYLVHTPSYLHFVWPWGYWAVQFFFVLSGFIIYFVNGQELGSGNGAVFAWRRFVRIFPTYWLILIVALMLRQFVGNPEFRIEITPYFLAHDLFLLPPDGLYINAAWSLRHELLFYAVFLVCIWDLRAGLALTASWLCIVSWTLYHSGYIDDGSRTLWNIISSPLNLLFFAGILMAIGTRRFALARFLEHGPPLSAWLGRISYPLYLCHMPTFLVVHGILKRIGYADNWMIAAPFGVALSVLTASMIALYFERPMLSWATLRARRFSVPRNISRPEATPALSR